MEPTITSSARPTAADAMVAPVVQLAEHSTVDRALDVLRGSHSEFALIRDDTGRCAGVITRDQLTAYSAEPWYIQETRLRDVAHDTGPFAGCDTGAQEAAAALRDRGLSALPVVDGDGYAVGILTAEGLQAVLGPPADNAT
jgi:CBS domain-containing protein